MVMVALDTIGLKCPQPILKVAAKTPEFRVKIDKAAENFARKYSFSRIAYFTNQRPSCFFRLN